MKKLLFVTSFMFLCLIAYSQTCTTLVYNNRIETFDWVGNWRTSQPNAGTSSLASSSPTQSTRIFGLGLGSSSIESNTYSLSNITGLNVFNTYQLKIKLASYKLSSSATSGGVDGGSSPDYVEVRISTDGGINFISEIRIRGFSNAFWDYNSNGVINKTANGTLTTFAPVAGGDRTTTGDGYSDITLTLPTGITQISIDLFARMNADGEEWWFDDIELFEIFNCTPLPIELISFEGQNTKNYNKLYWVTASEINNDYFTLERSVNGQDWVIVSKINGSGNSNTVISYEYKDYNYNRTQVNYYRLSQTDYDGTKEYFKTIAIQSDDYESDCNEYEYFNLSGVKIDINQVPTGIYLRKCNGIVEKIFKP